jgi:hypothetical protein
MSVITTAHLLATTRVVKPGGLGENAAIEVVEDQPLSARASARYQGRSLRSILAASHEIPYAH